MRPTELHTYTVSGKREKRKDPSCQQQEKEVASSGPDQKKKKKKCQGYTDNLMAALTARIRRLCIFRGLGKA